MSAYFYNQHQHVAHIQPTNGRSRRAPKMASQNARQFRGVKSMRELAEAPAVTAFRARFEAGRSFDLDDDLEFCPGLLTEDDLHSIHYASDRSSLSSGSPETSPLQHQIQPVQQVAPSISLSPAQANSYVHSGVAGNSNHPSYQQQQQQQRTRKVIPIINPTTGMTTSPPSSISPAMMQTAQRRW